MKRSRLSLFRLWIGPLLTLATAVALDVWSRTVFPVMTPAVVLQLSVVFAAFYGGMRSGLVSAGITIAYASYYFALHGDAFHDTTANFYRVLVVLVSTPTMAILVGMLQRRAERAFDLERDNAVLQARFAEREQAEAILRKTEQAAATGRMAARIAHEINNPLAGIKNSFLLIKDAFPQDHPHHGYVPRIEKEIDRIARIVRQMFVLYRPDQEYARTFDLNDLVRDAVALLHGRCQEDNVAISVEAPKVPLTVTLPEGSVSQILFNLLANAIEASKSGSVVKVIVSQRDQQVCLRVIDQGSGIPEELQSRIYEPFFTTKEGQPGRGLGLGLSTTRSLVEGMSGQIEFESRVGQGTTFRVFLPRQISSVASKPGNH